MSKVYYTNKKAREKEKNKIDPFKKTKGCGSGCACSVEKKQAPVNNPEGTTK